MAVCISPLVLEGLLLPCGKCVSCRDNRLNDIRSFVSKYDAVKLFFTLTYDDDSLPTLVDCDTVVRGNGEIVQNPDYDLNPNYPYSAPIVLRSDIKLFIKNLRNNLLYKYGKSIYKRFDFKYFITSEFGKKNGRPHYHGIFFLASDAKPWKMENDSEWYDFCNVISTAWPFSSKDRITPYISSITGKGINYVAKYINKPCYFDSPVKCFQLWSNGFRDLQEKSTFYESIYFGYGEFSFLRLTDAYNTILSPKVLPSVFHKPYRCSSSSVAEILSRIADPLTFQPLPNKLLEHSDDKSCIRSYKYFNKVIPILFSEYLFLLQRFYTKKALFSLRIQYSKFDPYNYTTSIIESLKIDSKNHDRSGSLKFCRYFGLTLDDFDLNVCKRYSNLSQFIALINNSIKSYHFEI